MATFKLISSTIIISLILGYFFYPKPNIVPVDPTLLPWHIIIDENQQSTVLGLKINTSTLQDAINSFGDDVSLALYADSQKPNIEVYFGYVEKAGLTAKVIVRLNVSIAEADDLLSNAKSRMQSNSNIPKIDINPADHYKALGMTISSITYMPKYSGLDTAYLLDRFGTPSHQITLSESATQFFYKDLGLSVISDREGKEVFQYTQPSQFVIPDQAIPYE